MWSLAVLLLANVQNSRQFIDLDHRGGVILRNLAFLVPNSFLPPTPKNMLFVLCWIAHRRQFLRFLIQIQFLEKPIIQHLLFLFRQLICSRCFAQFCITKFNYFFNRVYTFMLVFLVQLKWKYSSWTMVDFLCPSKVFSNPTNWVWTKIGM